MSDGAFTLLRVRGIPIRVHWTLLLVLPYFAFAFSSGFASIVRAAGETPKRLVLPPLVWGLLVTIALFASIAFHELAHTFVAIRLGGRVRRITLMMLGGVSEVERMPEGPSGEWRMAIAGPLASAAIGALLLALRAPLRGAPADLRMGVFYLGSVNLTLAAFNLLPAFPMDGGRILRGLLTPRAGLARATEIAAAVGRGLAVAMGMLGLLGGNVMLMLIALFTWTGAAQESAGERVRSALRGLRLRDVASPRPAIVSVREPLAVAPERMRMSGRSAAILVDDAGAPLGVLRVDDVASVPAERRAEIPAGDLAARVAARSSIAGADDDVADALARAGAVSGGWIVVVDREAPDAGARFALVGPQEIEAVIALRAPPPRRRAAWRRA